MAHSRHVTRILEKWDNLSPFNWKHLNIMYFSHPFIYSVRPSVRPPVRSFIRPFAGDEHMNTSTDHLKPVGRCYNSWAVYFKCYKSWCWYNWGCLLYYPNVRLSARPSDLFFRFSGKCMSLKRIMNLSIFRLNLLVTYRAWLDSIDHQWNRYSVVA